MKKSISVLLIIISLISCKSKEKADLIVYNATIYTVNNDFAKADAFAVKDGKFIAV
ncbi:MAG: amidohydrolase, partial [Flavobacteriia bacterium]|nr:amidohydrolase [Flavobacteriia bacterium]